MKTEAPRESLVGETRSRRDPHLETENRAPSSSSRRRRLVVASIYLLLASYAVLIDLARERRRTDFFHRDAVAWEGQAWSLDCGQLAGRDYISTYGPGSQWLARVGVRLHAADDYSSSPPRIDAAFRWAGVLGSALLIWIWPAGGAGSAATAAALFWIFGLPWNYTTMRPVAACIVLGIAIRWLLPTSNPSARAAVAAGALCLLPALITPELAVYTVGVLLVHTILATFLDLGRPRGLGEAFRFVRVPALAGAGFAGAVLLLEWFFWLTAQRAGARFGDYAGDTWRLMSTYAWTVGKPWTMEITTALGSAAFVAGTALILLLDAVRGPDRERRSKLGLALFSVSGLPAVLIRSDPGHLILALLPCVLALGLGVGRMSRGARWCTAGVLLCALAAWPAGDPRDAAARLGRLFMTSPAEGWRVLRQGEAPPRPFPEELLRRARTGAGPLFPFPYENHLAPATSRCLAQRVDQTYKAHDLELQRRQVDSLEKAGAGLTVWARFGRGLDGVQDATRSPIVVTHLLERFSSAGAGAVERNWLELQPRAASRDLPWVRIPLRPDTAGPTVAHAFEATFECTLLRATVAFDLSRFPRLKLPRARARLFRGESLVVETGLVPLAAGEEFSTLIDLAPGSSWSGLFADPPSASKVAVDRLEIEVERGDLWTRRAERVVLSRLDCL